MPDAAATPAHDPPEHRPEALGHIRSRGLLFPDDPGFLAPRTRKLLRSNDYELREAGAVRALVKEDDVALELGAGIGFMSTLMAKSCKAKRVHAFEANPTLIPYIRRVHQANGVADRIEVTNAVLGKRKGKVTFYEREQFSASSLIAEPTGEASPVLREHEVEVMNVNTVIRKLKPSVLVCDIEGAEADLLPAADLTHLRLAVVELHPQWIGKAGVQAVFDAFSAAGLTFFPRRSDKKVVTFRRDW